MANSAVMDRFIEERPLCVMTRCILAHLMNDDLNIVFQECRERQYDGHLPFVELATSVADVALGFCDNFNQAYKKYKQELEVSLVAFYGKLNRTEPTISEGVVRYSVDKATELMNALGGEPRPVLAGYKCSALDGNHLQKTEKRLGPLRGLCAAALPGTVVAKFDLQTELFERAYLLEDAHAQESTVLERVIADLQSKELLIADRHFCIVKFMLDVGAAMSCFLIRQHGRLKGELLGERRMVGPIETGTVYEQSMRITDGDRELILRRITVDLLKPTRDGDMQIHLLSNVPSQDATPCELAELYHQRWEIENAYHVLTMTLTCEVKSIGKPRAALFLFCMAMMAFNCRQVLYAALSTVHEQADVEAMSELSVALEIVRPMDGLLTAIPESEWNETVPTTVQGRAAFLRRVSKHVNVHAHRKSVRGPKKLQPPRKRCKAGTHVSTHRLLEDQK